MKKLEFTHGKYKVHFVLTDQFKTVEMLVNFKRPVVKEEIAKRNLLAETLLEATKNFPSKRLLEIESENLYNLYYNANSRLSGRYHILEFTAVFLNEKYTEEGMNEKSIAFLKDLIFSPYTEDNAFCKMAFTNAMRSTKEEMETAYDAPNDYSVMRLYEIMFPHSILSYREVGYLEDLENVTPNTLYELYQDILQEDIVDIFIVGDIDVEKTMSFLRKYFPSTEGRKKETSHFLTHDVYPKTIQDITEKKDYQQSKLLFGFKIEEMDSFEKQYTSYLYSFLLGGNPSSKLFKKIREQNSLCYTTYSTIRNISHTMIIYVGCDAEKKDQILKLVQECIEEINRGDFTEEDIARGQKVYRNSLLELEDDSSSIIKTLTTQVYLGYNDISKREKRIGEVTKEMIIQFGKKIKPDTIFLLEGGKDE